MEIKKARILISGLVVVLSIAIILTATAVFAEATYTNSPGQAIAVDNIVWVGPTENNPLGSAADFNGMIFGSIDDLADSEGPVASTGVVNLRGGIAADKDSTYLSHQPTWFGGDDIDNGKAAQMNIGLLLGNGGSSASSVNNGTVVYGATSSFTGASAITPVLSSQADTFMTNAKTSLENTNNILFNNPHSLLTNSSLGTVTLSGTEIIFTGTNPKWNVFEVNFDELAKLGKIQDCVFVYDIPTDSKVLINITSNDKSNVIVSGGSGVPKLRQQSDAKASPKFGGQVLFNIDPQITQVTYDTSYGAGGAGWPLGSVLAPKADFKAVTGDSSVNGTLVAKSVSSVSTGDIGAELHWFRFGGHPFNQSTPSSNVSSSASSDVSSSVSSSTSSSTSSTASSSVSSTTSSSTPTYPVVTPTNPSSSTITSSASTDSSVKTDSSAAEVSSDKTSGVISTDVPQTGDNVSHYVIILAGLLFACISLQIFKETRLKKTK